MWTEPHDEPLTMTALCPRCRTPFPVGVSMDDCGRILDNPLDFADLWAHTWTHNIDAGRS